MEQLVRVGVTGHMNLTPESVPLVAADLRRVLSEHEGPLVGVSCLARGADQVFARVVLELGGRLDVVIPAADYSERKVKPDNREEFEQLIGQATNVRVLPFETSNREAYVAANEAVFTSVDTLVAVWEGRTTGRQGRHRRHRGGSSRTRHPCHRRVARRCGTGLTRRQAPGAGSQSSVTGNRYRSATSVRTRRAVRGDSTTPRGTPGPAFL
jgi:hypothetical protein